MYRVGIDIGGTFTDMLLVGEDGSAVIGKTLDHAGRSEPGGGECAAAGVGERLGAKPASAAR